MTTAKPRPLATDGRDPWEQQPGETDHRYGQFCAFRDLGRTRTLKRACPAMHIQLRTAQEYGRLWSWPARCQAWDRHQDDLFNAQMFEHRRRMIEDHLAASRKLLTLFDAGIALLDPDDLTAADIVRLSEAWSKIVRVGAGEPDHTFALQGGDPAKPVTVDAVPREFLALPPHVRADRLLEMAEELRLRRAALNPDSGR